MQNIFITLGCRLNSLETEIIKEQLDNNKLTNKLVINTCAVTQKAENESLRQIKKIKKMYPDKEIIVTGCAVHTALDKLKSMPEIDKIIHNTKKLSLPAFEPTHAHETVVDIPDNTISTSPASSEVPASIPTLNSFTKRTRGYVQIQQGCDHRCSFCIIHKTRGKSVSFAADDIIHQVETLVNNGYKDITLTGVDISSWQRDIFNNTPSMLGTLCANILKKVPKLVRLRLSSLDPAVKDDTLISLLQHEERFMPHLHLSLQSLNNNVLNNMGRRHSQESAVEWINQIKTANSSIVLGADIICGFPKETEEHFLDTYKALKTLAIPLLHVFPYSERSHTPAAKMEQLPHHIRKQRALHLIELSTTLKQRFLDTKLGKIEEVLVEAHNIGHTKDYTQVEIIDKQVEKNTFIKALIVSHNNSVLRGQVVNV